MIFEYFEQVFPALFADVRERGFLRTQYFQRKRVRFVKSHPLHARYLLLRVEKFARVKRIARKQRAAAARTLAGKRVGGLYLLFALVQLALRNGVVFQTFEKICNRLNRLLRIGRLYPGINAQISVIYIRRRRGKHGIRQPLLFPYLKAGKYSLRLTEDLNRNGLVDTGNLLEHRQPEKVKFYKLENGTFLIDIPEMTELEQTIDVGELFK